MRIITWNCQGAFRKKLGSILKLEPDILIIQECEHIDKLKFEATLPKPNASYWYGDSQHKGIALFSFSEYKFELLPEFNPEFRYIIPFQITGNANSFILLAVWAMDNKENHDARYIGQIWLAINHYQSLLNGAVLLIGDFNSNKIWDKKRRVGNHSDVVSKLEEHNIHSVYHKLHGQEQGKEVHPTFFLQRKEVKPYHIDYCFVSADIFELVSAFEIGSYEEWIRLSDHLPLVIDFVD